MDSPLVVLKVEIPALDRLMDYLEGAQQQGIDSSTTALQELTSRLETSRLALDQALKENV